jgi:hypothetical protein
MYCMLPMNRISFLNLLETFTFRNKKMPRIEGKNIFYSVFADCQYGICARIDNTAQIV